MQASHSRTFCAIERIRDNLTIILQLIWKDMGY